MSAKKSFNKNAPQTPQELGRKLVREMSIRSRDIDVHKALTLIAQGATVEEKDERFGETPLLYAVGKRKYVDIVQALLAHGADMNARNPTGCTPLHLAIMSGCDEIAEMLIKAGADVNAKSKDGQTPLMLAPLAGHKGWQKCMKLLIANGAELRAVDAKGKTVLEREKENRFPSLNVISFLEKAFASEDVTIRRKAVTLRDDVFPAPPMRFIRPAAAQGTDASLSDDEYAKKLERPARRFEVFVDMDGVLSDFDSHGKATGKYDEKGQPKWRELDYNWWVTMPAFDGMKKFYNDLKAFGNVRILTSPTLSVACFQGKAAWVQNQWGKFGLNDLIICRGADKQFLARPHHILIDDRIANINDWNAQGGIGILHTGDYADTMKRVQEAVDAYEARIAATAPKPPQPKPPAA